MKLVVPVIAIIFGAWLVLTTIDHGVITIGGIIIGVATTLLWQEIDRR